MPSAWSATRSTFFSATRSRRCFSARAGRWVIAAGFRLSLWVAQLRGLVLCSLRRGDLSAGAATDSGTRGGGAVGRTKDLLLLPVWLMGVSAWRWWAALPPIWGRHCARRRSGVSSGSRRLAASICSNVRHYSWLPGGFSAYDYIVGMLVALFIVGLANAPLPMPGAAVQRLIRFLAGTTFGLYLMHYPLYDPSRDRDPRPGRTPRRIGFCYSGLTLGGSIAFSRT